MALAVGLQAAAPPEFGPQWPDARPVSFISEDTAVLNYQTAGPAPTRVQLRIGSCPASTPGFESAWKDARIVEGPQRATTRHTLTLTGLKPATRYYYRVYDPAARTDPAWSAEPPWTREWAFATLAAPGHTSFVRVPVKVLIVPNVLQLDTVRPGALRPEPMPPDELDLYKRSIGEAVLFNWVNSRMRYWLDCEFFVESEWQRVGEERPDLPEWARGLTPVRDGLRVFDPADIANHEANPPLKDNRIWTGQVVIICERRWDADQGRWFYEGSGGGTFGVDWMLWDDETQRPAPGRSSWLGGSDQAWLMCHEFHHQTESQYAFSGLTSERDRVVFDHFSPAFRGPSDTWEWDTAFNHGEHWDGIAWELRMLTDAQHFRNIFGEIATARDTDSDGIPDDDPRLPLDEKRLGSDPARPATDGVTCDMQKLLFARWVPALLADLRDRQANPGYEPMWQAVAGLAQVRSPDRKPLAGYAWPDVRKTDSDGDGVPDAEDPYPIYPWEPVIRRAEIRADGDAADWEQLAPIGHLEAGGVVCTLKTAHDDRNLYYLVDLTGAYSSVMFNIDADADGWYVGNDNVQIVVGQPARKDDPGPGHWPGGAELNPAGKPVIRQDICHIASNRAWPYWDDGTPVQWTDENTRKEYVWQRPRMFGDWRDVVCATSVTGQGPQSRKIIEIALANGGGKMPIQAAPGHRIALALYINFARQGPLSIYEPYTLFATTWR